MSRVFIIDVCVCVCVCIGMHTHNHIVQCYQIGKAFAQLQVPKRRRK